jgi:hypothetical protein
MSIKVWLIPPSLDPNIWRCSCLEGPIDFQSKMKLIAAEYGQPRLTVTAHPSPKVLDNHFLQAVVTAAVLKCEEHRKSSTRLFEANLENLRSNASFGYFADWRCLSKPHQAILKVASAFLAASKGLMIDNWSDIRKHLADQLAVSEAFLSEDIQRFVKFKLQGLNVDDVRRVNEKAAEIFILLAGNSFHLQSSTSMKHAIFSSQSGILKIDTNCKVRPKEDKRLHIKN